MCIYICIKLVSLWTMEARMMCHNTHVPRVLSILYNVDVANDIFYGFLTLRRNDLIWRNENNVGGIVAYDCSIVPPTRTHVDVYRCVTERIVLSCSLQTGGAVMTLHNIHRVGRPVMIGGWCPGWWLRTYVHDTRKRAVVSVGHICSSVVIIGPLRHHHSLPSPPFPTTLSEYQLGYCVTCVGTVCRRVCVSSTFYQTGEIKKENIHIHPPITP